MLDPMSPAGSAPDASGFPLQSWREPSTTTRQRSKGAQSGVETVGSNEQLGPHRAALCKADLDAVRELLQTADPEPSG